MLVSVIMPTYNCGKYILQSLDSVIAQTVTDWEVQIVDDCSTDNTAEVLKPYLEKYPNIHYCSSTEWRSSGCSIRSYKTSDWQVYCISR